MKAINTRKVIITMVAAGLVGCAATTQATLTFISPGTAALGPFATGYSISGGTLVDQLLDQQYSIGTTDEGTVSTQVYSGDANNSLGGLTFLYTISIAKGDATGLQLSGLWGLSLNAGVVGGVGIATVTGSVQDIASYNYAASAGSMTIKFLGNEPLPSALEFVVDTSVQADQESFGSIQDSGVAPNIPILTPVPEPSTVVAGALLLLPLGIGAIHSLRKERKV